MDILISSNLERLLYLLTEDTELVASLMATLNRDGVYSIPESLKQAIQAQFYAGFCDDAQAKQTIAKVWNDHHYLCDTHTATAWAVAEDYVAQTGDDSPMVVLSTASAYKFPEAVLSSLEQTLPEDDFACIDRLWELTGVPVPENLKGLQQKKVLHPGVIEKEEMLSYVTAL